ncbi:hypothetical protein C0J52_11354 [Blattella germanica]|nr:hypothetical protein C0J52_11354 [Blattella germanica]
MYYSCKTLSSNGTFSLEFQILQLQMNDYRYHYMFTTFDIETFDLEDFKYNSVNITAFRLVDVEDSRVLETLEQMERFQPIGHAILNRSGIIQAEPALMYDSVHVFAKGLAALDRSHVLKPTNLSCEDEQPWDDGLSLYNYINSVRFTKTVYTFFDIASSEVYYLSDSL